jgi:hypothetical protein
VERIASADGSGRDEVRTKFLNQTLVNSNACAGKESALALYLPIEVDAYSPAPLQLFAYALFWWSGIEHSDLLHVEAVDTTRHPRKTRMRLAGFQVDSK